MRFNLLFLRSLHGPLARGISHKSFLPPSAQPLDLRSLSARLVRRISHNFSSPPPRLAQPLNLRTLPGRLARGISHTMVRFRVDAFGPAPSIALELGWKW